MKILITGSSGLIGSHFTELITQDPKYEVRRFDGDVRSREDVLRNLRDIDTVIHLAALTFVPPSWENPSAYMEVNYGGTLNILDSYKMFSKMVYIGSSHEYGNQEKFPIERNAERLPLDPYSISKRAAVDAVRLYSSRYEFDSLIIRPFNNFGPRQSRNFVVPTMIRQALNGGKITLHGDSEKEFIYVKDTARAIKSFIDKRLTGIVHVCKGEAYRVSWLAEEILKALGFDGGNLTVLPSDRPYDIKKLLGDPSSLYEVLPDFQFTPMEWAIKETIDYYRNNHETRSV